MSTISDRVIRLVSEQFNVDIEECNNETLFEEFNADSLDSIELLMAIEQEFDLDIADEIANEFKTIQDVVTHLERASTSE